MLNRIGLLGYVAVAAVSFAAAASAQSYIERPTSSDFVRSLGSDGGSLPQASDEAPLRMKGTTRGLRLNVAPATPAVAPMATPVATTATVVPAPAAAARPAREPAAAPRPAREAAAAPARAPSLNFPVQFEFGSADLTAQARTVLNELGAALSSSELTPYRFKLVGHTDAVGSDEYNLDLSKRRALAVEQYLKDKFGIEPSRVTALGVGKAQPFNAQNPFDSINRRVEIVREGRKDG